MAPGAANHTVDFTARNIPLATTAGTRDSQVDLQGPDGANVDSTDPCPAGSAVGRLDTSTGARIDRARPQQIDGQCPCVVASESVAHVGRGGPAVGALVHAAAYIGKMRFTWVHCERRPQRGCRAARTYGSSYVRRPSTCRRLESQCRRGPLPGPRGQAQGRRRRTPTDRTPTRSLPRSRAAVLRLRPCGFIRGIARVASFRRHLAGAFSRRPHSTNTSGIRPFTCPRRTRCRSRWRRRCRRGRSASRCRPVREVC